MRRREKQNGKERKKKFSVDMYFGITYLNGPNPLTKQNLRMF